MLNGSGRDVMGNIKQCHPDQMLDEAVSQLICSAGRASKASYKAVNRLFFHHAECLSDVYRQRQRRLVARCAAFALGGFASSSGCLERNET
jgi:hypothetical protein